MHSFRRALLGLVAAAAIAAPVLAQQHITSFDGVMLYYPDTGRMVMGHIDKEAMETAMKHAKPLNGPVMIIMQGGKAYIVENMMEKMPNGQTMIDYFDRKTYSFSQ